MQTSNVWLATALLHERVRNSRGEILGRLEDIVVDPVSGNIEYAVLALDGGPAMNDRLYAIPWSSLRMSPARDYMFLNLDRERLVRSPSFDRERWPDFGDSTWRRGIDDYYGTRPAYVAEPVRPVRRGMSLGAGIGLVILILALGWMAFLVSTRGWEQTKHDVKGSMQSAVYAAKETTHDAALTTKVKTALALSKRVESKSINVDSWATSSLCEAKSRRRRLPRRRSRSRGMFKAWGTFMNQLVTSPQSQ